MTSYTIEGRTERGESGEGAWYATDAQGRRVIVKRLPDVTALPRFELLRGTLDALRAKGYPTPRYTAIDVDGTDLVLAQSRLDGRIDVDVNERTVADVLRLNGLQADVAAPTFHGKASFGDLIVHSLVVGEDGWCEHQSLRDHSARARVLVEQAEAIGVATDPAWFPETGVVHLDLHDGNLLLADDGSIAGIVDWEGACAGDHRFDLTSFAFCAEVNRGTTPSMQPVWDALEATVEPRVLRAYAAHQALRLVDWMIRHHEPADVDVWLDAGERFMARYDS